AFHHQIHPGVHLGHAEGAGQYAVVAGDTAWLARRLDHAVAGALDRVGGADLRAGRRVAVHTHHRHGLGRDLTVDVVELDHRVALVCVTFAARLDAGIAADAAARVDEELHLLGGWHNVSLSSAVSFQSSALSFQSSAFSSQLSVFSLQS